MNILAPKKFLNFKNSITMGRMPCVLLPGKRLKTPAKLIYTYTITTITEILPNFYSKIMPIFRLDYFSSIKPLKAISIATP